MEMMRKDGMCWYFPSCSRRAAPGCDAVVKNTVVAVCREHATSSKYATVKESKGT